MAIKSKRWGIYRVNKKPVKNKALWKKELLKEKKIEWNGDPLLEPYYPGIAKISEDLYNDVVERSNGICEICGRNKAEEVHHLVGRNRKAHLNNILHLCIKCHKPPIGIHANSHLWEKYMKIYQDWCFEQGYTEEDIRFLLGTKDNRLF